GGAARSYAHERRQERVDRRRARESDAPLQREQRAQRDGRVERDAPGGARAPRERVIEDERASEERRRPDVEEPEPLHERGAERLELVGGDAEQGGEITHGPSPSRRAAPGAPRAPSSRAWRPWRGSGAPGRRRHRRPSPRARPTPSGAPRRAARQACTP